MSGNLFNWMKIKIDWAVCRVRRNVNCVMYLEWIMRHTTNLWKTWYEVLTCFRDNIKMEEFRPKRSSNPRRTQSESVWVFHYEEKPRNRGYAEEVPQGAMDCTAEKRWYWDEYRIGWAQRCEERIGGIILIILSNIVTQKLGALKTTGVMGVDHGENHKSSFHHRDFPTFTTEELQLAVRMIKDRKDPDPDGRNLLARCWRRFLLRSQCCYWRCITRAWHGGILRLLKNTTLGADRQQKKVT